MTVTINAPSDFTGTSYIGPLILAFDQGVATYDGDLPDGIRTYLAAQGYGIDEAAADLKPAPLITDLNGDPVDSRDHPDVLHGAPLRDAAVDPQPVDFLPPVNAGQADPHGDQVVSPGIHAVGTKAVVPGPVGSVGTAAKVVVKDTEAQEAKETQLAQSTLVDGNPVPEATAELAKLDPINTDQVVAAGPPAGNASTDDWRAYALAQGLDSDRVSKMSRDQIRDELVTTD